MKVPASGSAAARRLSGYCGPGWTSAAAAVMSQPAEKAGVGLLEIDGPPRGDAVAGAFAEELLMERRKVVLGE